MAETRTELRVVVASPGDVRAERNAVRVVAEELSRHGVAADRLLRLTPVLWEDNTFPGFDTDEPQALISRLLRIRDCDVFVCIMWHRFGTPTLKADSGTAKELSEAIEEWKAVGKPHIMCYFSQAPYTPRNKEESQQWTAVLEFKSMLPKECFYWDYEGADAFESTFRGHLNDWIRDQFPILMQQMAGAETSQPESGIAAQAVEPVTTPRQADESFGAPLPIEPDSDHAEPSRRVAASPRSTGEDEISLRALSELPSRDQVVSEIALGVESDSVRIVLLVGPRGIGKTHLANRASQILSRQTSAIGPGAGDDAIRKALACIASDSVTVFEEPDRGQSRLIVRELLDRQGVTAIVTSETSEAPNHIEFVSDSRIKVIRIAPLDDTAAEALLKSADGKLHYDLQRWVIRMAGGNPGILLQAAATVHSNSDTASCANQMGLAMEAEVRSVLGAHSLACLRALSVLRYVDVSSTNDPDLRLLCQAAGGGIRPADLQSEVRRLADAGYCTVASTRVAVTPAVLADHLARNVIRFRAASFARIAPKLSRSGRSALYERMARTGEAGAVFWNGLLFGDGAYSTLSAAANESKLLRSAAAGIPAATGYMLERNLGEMDTAQREAVAGNQRSELRWALEELLFKRDSAAQALRCLALLAEAENETWSNNSTGVFCESFAPLHPQIPLPVAERLTTLRELLREGSTKIRVLVAKAAALAVDPMGAVSLRTSVGAGPFDKPESSTYGEAYDYIEDLCDLLLEIGASTDATVAEMAQSLLPQALVHATTSGRPMSGLDRIGRLIEAGRSDLRVDLGKVLSSISWVRFTFVDIAKRIPDRRQEYMGYATATGELRRRLLRSNYGLQFRTLIGVENSHDVVFDRNRNWRSADGWQRPEVDYRARIHALAVKACTKRSPLRDDLWNWLASPLARHREIFLRHLGECDVERAWLPRAERLAIDGHEREFAQYVAGHGSVDSDFVEDYLDSLENGGISPSAIASATFFCYPSARARQRIEDLAHELKINADSLSEGIRMWSQAIDEGQLLRLLALFGGIGPGSGEATVRAIDWWCGVLRRPMSPALAGIAGDSLLALGDIRYARMHEADAVAELIVSSDIDLAFAIFHEVMARLATGNSWNPFLFPTRMGLVKSLQLADNKRYVLALLKVAHNNPRLIFDLKLSTVPPLDLAVAKDALVEYASLGEVEAVLVARLIPLRQAPFMEIASTLIDTYPGSGDLRKALSNTVCEVNMWSGRRSDVIESRLQLVQEALANEHSPTTTAWLRETELKLRESVSLERASENVQPGLLDNVSMSDDDFDWAD